MADPFWVTANLPPPKAPPVRREGAKGFGMIGETVKTLIDPESARGRNPNALEQGIMDLSQNPLIKGSAATYKQAVANGIIMQPVRAAMQHSGVGMDELKKKYPGRSQEWYDKALDRAYSETVRRVRTQATDEANAAKITPKVNTFEEMVTGKAKPTLGERVGRLTQQTVNVGANVVANPQYFLIPGLSFGGNMATRVGSAAAAEGAVGFASDGAAQLMDIATETKKDFDVQQSLQNTLLSAGFGGAFRGGIEVAPYVKDLFKARGMDTTPSADVINSKITPMTRDHVEMNQADAAQYQELLKTGSVDDIKAFFQGRNGPQPKWVEVNDWVKHRDGVTRTGPVVDELQPKFDYETQYNSKAEQDWADQNRTAVHDHVTAQAAQWKNAPEIEVVSHPNQIEDPTIREQILKEDPNGDALGVLGADGKVRIFSDRIPDADTANAVLFHESLGHFGLEQKFGARLDQTIKSLLHRNVSQFAKHVDAWQKKNPKAYGGDRIRAAEEVLANYSNKGQIKKSWQDALTASVRQFGRKMGVDLAYSDIEIRHIMAMAHDAVVNGKKSAALNGFRGAVPSEKSNKFIFTGPKAEHFDPADPTAYRAQDGELRNELDDSNAKLKDVPQRGDYNLEEVLDHPELFENYPQLRELEVRFDKMDPEETGYYVTREGDEPAHIGVNTANAIDQRQVILHEVQHAIQEIEGRIGPDTPGTTHLSFEDYVNSAPEREAIATQNRQDMSFVQRIKNEPTFMRKSDIAAQEDFVAHDLERVYKALDEGYVPTKRTWAEDKRDALELGFSPSQIKDLRERNPGELSVRLRRMQAAANMADARLEELEARLDTDAWTMRDQAEYLKTIADFNYLTVRIKGEKAEYARALNAAKTARSYTNKSMAEVAAMLEAEGSGLSRLADDPTAFSKFAREVKALRKSGNVKGAQAKIAGVNKPYWEQYATSYHYNAMLSGLGTHVKAPLDMMIGISHNVIDHTLAWPIGKMVNLVESMTGQKVKPGVTKNELAARINGIIRAVFDHEVYTRTLQAAKRGEGGAVLPSGEFIPKDASLSYAGVRNPRIGILSKPTDLIIAEDTYFRSVSMSETLYGLGAREAEIQLKAAGQPYTMDDVLTLGAALAREPTPTMLKQADEITEKTLLLNANSLTNWIDKVKAVRPGATIGERITSWLANNLAPFIRVSANSLITRTLERSPAAFLSPAVRKTIAAGGPEAHTALARIAYGTVLLGLYWNAAEMVTGSGPDNPAKKTELQAAGWRQNAVKKDGKMETGGTLAASLNPFDMHNTTAQAVADLRRAYEKGANQGQVATGLKLALGSIINYMTSQTWVDSVKPGVEAATAEGNTASKVNQFFGSQAKSWVPAAVGQAARITNPNQVDARPETDSIDPTNITGSIVNNVKAAVPGLNESLPVKYSVYGNPLPTGQSVVGARTGIPGLDGNAVEETTDPAEQELNRLTTSGLRFELDNGDVINLKKSALITPVQRTLDPSEDDLYALQDNGRDDLKVEDGLVKLTTAQFQDYQRLAGRYIVESVREEMSTPEWQEMSDEEKVLLIKDIQTDMKKAAREALFYGPK